MNVSQPGAAFHLFSHKKAFSLWLFMLHFSYRIYFILFCNQSLLEAGCVLIYAPNSDNILVFIPWWGSGSFVFWWHCSLTFSFTGAIVCLFFFWKGFLISIWSWEDLTQLTLSPGWSLNWSRIPHLGHRSGDHNIPVQFFCILVSVVVQTLQVFMSLTIFLHSIYDYPVYGGPCEPWWGHWAPSWAK